jgi:HipA-like protein
MNGYLVGTLTKTATGAHTFAYTPDWLTQPGARPISLSLPLLLQLKSILHGTTNRVRLENLIVN